MLMAFYHVFVARGGGEFFGPSGVVDSPEWPRPYSNFADCYLKITCGKTQIIGCKDCSEKN